MHSLLRILVLWVLTITVVSSCTKKLTKATVVYDNDFERDGQSRVSIFDSTGWDPGKIFHFNNSTVLGPINNGIVFIDVKSMPEHNVLEVAYDLYIHDNWEGNKPTTNGVPDLFVVRYDGVAKLMTTFSNNPLYKQAYPDWYTQANNPPLANSLDINLPGRCALLKSAHGSSYYRMVQSFAHTNTDFQLSLSDALQPRGSSCEKSWSVDNVLITAYKYY
jgi:hypothetical protein